MHTKQNRTRYNTSYVTSGNLALAPTQSIVFTVIEGGASQESVRPHERVAERRAERKAVESATRIRCVVAFALVVMAIVSAAFISDGLSSAKVERSFANIATACVTVSAGDSLWEIAESHPVEGRSVRDVMQWIARTNDLSSATLFVGQELLVPMS